MDPRAALTEAVQAWRKTKNPRFAALADWATARALPEPRPLVGASAKKADVAAWLALLEAGDALDLPRLLAAVPCGKSALAAERVTLLAKLNDPRVISGVLALLEAPPFRAKTALPFFRACATALANSNDPRVRPALEDLARRYKAIVETSVGDDVGALLRRTAETLDQVKPGPLPAALEQKAAALEALFEAERTRTQRHASQSRTTGQSDEALLAAIYAAPDDDGPRMVYADTLTERGDVRGEFIALQLARARGHATAEQRRRERELLADPKRRAAWSLPLSQGGEAHFERGLPFELMLDPRTLKHLVGLPALATLKGLDGLDRDPPLKHTVALLTSEHARRVTRVDTLGRKLFDALEGPLPWSSVGLSFFPQRTEAQRLAQVKTLRVTDWLSDTLSPGAFEELTALRSLTLALKKLPTAEALAPLVHLEHFASTAFLPDVDFGQLLGGKPKLVSLDVGSSPSGAQVRGLPLQRLSCSLTPTLEIDALLAELPGLVELSVKANHLGAEDLPRLLASPRVRQLRGLSVGDFHFVRPFGADGVLEVHVRNRMTEALERVAKAVARVPEGAVGRVVVRPVGAVGAELTEEQVAVVRGGLGGVGALPLEFDW